MIPGTLGHALLGLVAQQPMTGYELTRTFDESLANVWSAQHSQIYPELAKLLRGGYIAQSDAGPRGAKRYDITPEGRAELERWLLEDEPASVLRSEPMLRVFFLWTLRPPDAACYLRGLHAKFSAQVQRFEAIAERLGDTPPERMARVALEAGLLTERALVTWADWAAGEVERAPAVSE